MKRTATEDFLPGLLELPSGHVDEDETLVVALARELQEETNLKLTSIRDIGKSFDYLSHSGKKKRQINFIVQAIGQLRLNPEEHSRFYWMTKSEVQNTAQMLEQNRNIIFDAYEQLSDTNLAIIVSCLLGCRCR